MENRRRSIIKVLVMNKKITLRQHRKPEHKSRRHGDARPCRRSDRTDRPRAWGDARDGVREEVVYQNAPASKKILIQQSSSQR